MRLWVGGARLRTLPAALSPVLVGTAAVFNDVVWWRAGMALVVSVALQVGVNFANDYSDGVRGVDAQRVGPTRLVGSGQVSPGKVKWAAFACFGVALVAGLTLALAVGYELIPVGAAAVAAAWFYTGGPRPYGYAGFGELFVFVFFGLVATVGSAYVHVATVRPLAVAAAVPVGLLAVALLVTNNLRDLPLDAAAGKHTLAVRLGERLTRRLYVGLLGLAFAVTGLLATGRLWALLGLAALVAAVNPIRGVQAGRSGQALVPVLAATGRLQLLHAVLLACGLAISA